MKKFILGAVLGVLFFGAVVAFTCDLKKRDKLYDECVVRMQCGQSNLCKSDCLNEANKAAGCS